jgi:hypothetical protein
VIFFNCKTGILWMSKDKVMDAQEEDLVLNATFDETAVEADNIREQKIAARRQRLKSQFVVFFIFQMFVANKMSHKKVLNMIKCWQNIKRHWMMSDKS